MGLIALAYERPWGALSRLPQMALAYLLELRIERGPIGEEEAFELLDGWARERRLGPNREEP